MSSRAVLAAALAVLFAAPAVAQSNAVVDDLLSQQRALLGPTAYIVLTAAGMLPEEAGYEQAVDLVRAQGWLRGDLDPAEEVRLGRFSKLVVEVFGINAGLMYRIIKAPRYAARELSYRDYFRGSSASLRPISGEFVLRIVGRALEREPTR